MVDLENNGVNVDTATVSLDDLEGNLVADVLRLPHNARHVRREGDRQTTLGVPLTSHAAFSGGSDGFRYASLRAGKGWKCWQSLVMRSWPAYWTTWR